MPSADRWVLLSYRIPREPSAPRLAVWRRLNRLGVAKLIDGLVALPLDSRNREQLEWAAEQVIEAGGDAAVWLADATTKAQSRGLATNMAEAIADSYNDVRVEAESAVGLAQRDRRRVLSRLRRELARIRRRDYFPPREREAAHQAVEALAGAVQEAAA